ncbi:hypothetical protein L596_022197 [Steinernema carpocapsae]|nr:hypothetical protein L596_022197 [Steinernema carpocapsae]
MVVLGILFAGAAIFGILHKKPYFAKIVCFGILGLIVGAITISIYSLFKKVNFHEYVRFISKGLFGGETIPEEKIPVAVVILVLMYLVMPLMTAPVLMHTTVRLRRTTIMWTVIKPFNLPLIHLTQLVICANMNRFTHTYLKRRY